MIDGTQAFEQAKHERDQKRQEEAPICKSCNTKTHFDNDCLDYICGECGTHYSKDGSELRFCVQCNWNKSNFSPLDAGESWEPEPSIGGDDWGEM